MNNNQPQQVSKIESTPTVPDVTSEGEAPTTTEALPTIVSVHGHTFQPKPGWHVYDEELPRPTYWPVVMGVAITFLAFGVVTSLIISAVGVLMFIVSLVGWIGELRNEQQRHKH